MHGLVVRQAPVPHAKVRRWDPVTVWVEIPPDDGAGVREPRRPPPPVHVRKGFVDEGGDQDITVLNPG